MFKNFKKLLSVLVVITLASAVLVSTTSAVQFNQNWRTADRSSAGIAPLPQSTEEAIVQVYVARVFNWRGLFAVHPWIAIKPKGAKAYTVHQVIGWRHSAKQSVLRSRKDIPDRHWYGNKPQVLVDLRGEKAEVVIKPILEAIDSYPYPYSYSQWPGPNSNTFIAHIGREVPALHLNLPATAIGKDYLGPTNFIAKAPSGTGYQISVLGLLGVLLSKDEGLEVSILTMNFGVNPFKLSAKLPAVGAVSVR